MADQQPRVPGDVWVRIVSQAWSDQTFEERLLADPKAVLAEHGFDPPSGVDYEVHKCTDSLLHVVVPEGQLEDADENATPIRKMLNEVLADPTLEQRLMSDPKAFIEEKEIKLPPGVDVKVWKDTADRHHLVVRSAPAESVELSDAELEAVTGGRRKVDDMQLF